MNEHFDVIIIGTGAGGGTLAYRLAPSGKRILLLERGGYVPREKANWDSHAVVVLTGRRAYSAEMVMPRLRSARRARRSSRRAPSRFPGVSPASRRG